MSKCRRMFCLFLNSFFLLLISACGTTPGPTTDVLQLEPTPTPRIAPTVTSPASDQPVVESSPTQASIDELEPLPTAVAIDLPRLRPGTEIRLTSVQMISDEIGWGISGWHILRTEDGGLSWQDVTPPESRLLESDGPAEAIGTFVDDTKASIVFLDLKRLPMMLTVWTTHDGGASWAASAPVFPVGAGEFFEAYLRLQDEWNVWLLTDTIVMGTGRNDAYSLFHSQDGGRNWSEYNLHPYEVTDFVLMDQIHGWMSEAKIGPYDSVTPFLSFTSDGGKSWDTINLPPPGNYPSLFEDYKFCSTFKVQQVAALLVAVIECSIDPYSTEESLSFLYRSTDEGANWVADQMPQSIQAGSELILFDAQNALLLGKEMYRTSNGGISWELFKQVNWTGKFSFVDPDRGWAIAQAGDELALVKTVDGGLTWSILEPHTVTTLP